MIAIGISICIAVIIYFSLLSCSVYKVPRSKIVKASIFLMFLSIQISPISFFYIYEGRTEIRDAYYEKEFARCMNKFDKPIVCNDIAKSTTANDFDSPNFGLLFLLSIFIIIPTSGIALMFAEALVRKIDQKNRYLSYLKALLRFVAVATFLAFGFIIIWGFCLPQTHVPAQIKTINLIVGLPLLMIVYVLIEAFGKAFAHSGIHSPQNAAAELIEMNKIRANPKMKADD